MLVCKMNDMEFPVCHKMQFSAGVYQASYSMGYTWFILL